MLQAFVEHSFDMLRYAMWHIYIYNIRGSDRSEVLVLVPLAVALLIALYLEWF